MKDQRHLPTRVAGLLALLRHACAAALVASAMVACDSAERSTAPTSTVSVNAAVGTSDPQSLAQAFVDAQGTTCDLARFECPIFKRFGIGTAVYWCDYGCVNYFKVDFGGLYRRWWAQNGLPEYTPYYYTGSVTEHRLADGRRRLVVNIHGHNTFVDFGVADPSDRSLIGSSIIEWPLLTDNPVMPTLGEASLSADLIVPANFVGMPDMTQMVFWPVEGMEIRRWNINVSATGVLRDSYNGIPAGTLVDATGSATYLPKLESVVLNSRRMVEVVYEPMSRVTIKRSSPK